jgi:uncharacterized protein YicC (UPF0701 family)
MPDTPEGRVTLAILAEKIDHLSEKIGVIDIRTGRMVEDHEHRVRALERCTTKTDAELVEHHRLLLEHERDIEEVKKVSNFWNGANSLAVAFATFLGITK